MADTGKAGDPTLSVVITIVEGGDYVREILRSLAASVNPPPLDIIVPFDDSVADVAAYATEFPAVRFLNLGRITPARPITTEAGKHELYDRRRAAGLAAATGDIVGILEDRGRPDPNWARALVRQHALPGRNVVGGAVECREPANVFNWAFYASEFGRYGRPFVAGPADWVTDINVSYSRKAIEATRHLWKDRYHEPIVNWHLIGMGEKLWLSDEVVVYHGRPPLTFGMLLPERFHWGRLFGEIRVREAPPTRRWAMILASPLIPPLLWVRQFRLQASKGRAGRYLRALPYVIALTTAWTVGEVTGYITRRG